MKKQKLAVLREYYIRAGMIPAGALLFRGAIKPRNWRKVASRFLGSQRKAESISSLPFVFSTPRTRVEMLSALMIPPTFDLLKNNEKLRPLTTELLHSRLAFAVFCKDSKKQIGLLTLTNITTEDGVKELELGYRVHHQKTGKGLATEMVQGLVDHLFQHTDLQRIVSVIQPENLASIKVATKVGMTFDRLTKYRAVEVQLFVMERSDFQAAGQRSTA